MAKCFNVAADCKPDMHYMVNIDQRLSDVKEMIDAGKYFTINRARQYGKTTTLRGLVHYLQGDYYVVLMDFQTISNAKFKNENTFSNTFAKMFVRGLKNNRLSSSSELKMAIAQLDENVKKDGKITNCRNCLKICVGYAEVLTSGLSL